jgi:hypothetical protein
MLRTEKGRQEKIERNKRGHEEEGIPGINLAGPCER